MKSVIDRVHDDVCGYAVRPAQLLSGNEVVPLIGGSEAFPVMLGAIARARRTVCLETYIMEPDQTGVQFADALIERARAGVTVRLIYDAIGGIALGRAFLFRMIEAGVRVIEYHPITPWSKRFDLIRRDHRKILVVDDEVGFTGGLNISDDYTAEVDGGRGWHDVHCLVRGPVVTELARMFRRVWVREGGEPYEIQPCPPPPAGACMARVLGNRLFRKRWSIRRAYLHAINRAREFIYIANAYFLPDRATRRALYNASKRGVKVRVIVPGESDIAVAQYAAEHLFGRLLQQDIEILLWPGPMMHAKIAVIDAVWSTIGSYNLNRRSLRYDLEVVLEVVDRDVGERMRGQFDADAARCVPYTLQAWQGRSWFRRGLSWLFYQLRRWL